MRVVPSVRVWTVACVVFWCSACPADGQTTSVSSGVATVSSPSPPSSDCTPILACEADTSCSACLNVLKQWAVPPITTPAENVLFENSFFTALKSNASCTHLTPPVFELLLGAVAVGAERLQCQSLIGSQANFKMFSMCQAVVARCSLNATCSACLSLVFQTQRGDYVSALHNASCLAVGMDTLLEAATVCDSFPGCTYAKALCGADDLCGPCSGQLQNGNAAGAVDGCPNVYGNSTTGLILDALVLRCVGEETVNCNFWSLRCQAMPVCGECLAAGDYLASPPSIVAARGSPECAPLVHVLQENWTSAPVRYTKYYGSHCPLTVVSDCSAATTQCVALSPDCFECMNGSSAMTQSECNDVYDLFQIDLACQECPNIVHVSNDIVTATSVVGGVSVVACTYVILLLFAWKKDVESSRFRIIIGLMFANAVYSTANTIPLELLGTGLDNCGVYLLNSETRVFGRAWWFLGKYSLVGFEIFILILSTAALTYGRRVMSTKIEIASHVTCVVIGVAAFIGYYASAWRIYKEGFNHDTSHEFEFNSFSHLNANDDMNDATPAAGARELLAQQARKSTELLETMLQVWVGLLVVATLLWLRLRWVYRRLLQCISGSV